MIVTLLHACGLQLRAGACTGWALGLAPRHGMWLGRLQQERGRVVPPPAARAAPLRSAHLQHTAAPARARALQPTRWQ